MKIYHIGVDHGDEIKEPICACIGYFDGLHLGHQKLVECVVETARQTNTQPSLITFEPDPWKVIKHLENIPHITPMKKRMQIGEQLGIKNWIILDFTKSMAELSVEGFHQEVLGKLNLHTLVCGYDFHYAGMGKGSVDTLLNQKDFDVKVVEEVDSEHQKISSTRIEKLLEEGRMEKATAIMGRAYEIEGHVKEGNHIGRTVGFPTVNLLMDDHYITPKQGVYIGEVLYNDIWYPAIMNVGHNPSFNYQKDTSMEAHLLDFQKDIYGEAVTFRFLSFLREECRFPGKEDFMAQLKQDEQTARTYFQKRKEGSACV